ncbi:hypothetical protein LQW54_006832 [Pestalotiopsis sp. IQ-011]
MQPNPPDDLQNVTADITPHIHEQDATDTTSAERSQPWKQHLDEIQKYNRENNVDTDFFRPYEILINLPSSDNSKSDYRRHNQEFEDREAVVQDVRGHEDQFSLDKNGVCWRKWEGPADWRGLNATGVMKLGHENIRSGYIKAVEDFIRQELEKQDGKPIGIVKVFDYRLRVSSDPEEFEARVLNLNDGLDPVIPTTHPHVDQSFLGSKMRVREHMGELAEELLKRRFRIIK